MLFDWRPWVQRASNPASVEPGDQRSEPPSVESTVPRQKCARVRVVIKQMMKRYVHADSSFTITHWRQQPELVPPRHNTAGSTVSPRLTHSLTALVLGRLEHNDVHVLLAPRVHGATLLLFSLLLLPLGRRRWLLVHLFCYVRCYVCWSNDVCAYLALLFGSCSRVLALVLNSPNLSRLECSADRRRDASISATQRCFRLVRGYPALRVL